MNCQRQTGAYDHVTHQGCNFRNYLIKIDQKSWKLEFNTKQNL